MTRIITARAWMLALVLAVVAAAGPLVWRAGQAPPHAASDRLARRLVADIVAGRNAGRALCQLQGLRRYYSRPRYEPDACDVETVKAVVSSPDGERTVHAVVTHPSWHDTDAAEGVLTFFDDRGFLLPVFAGANLIASEHSIFEYRAGHSAVVLDVPTHVSDGVTALVVHVVPLARRQRPLLSVIVGPPSAGMCTGPSWGWQLRDTDGDGVPEFEIGPNLARPGAIEPRVVYRWSADRGHYVGPDGAPAEGFLRTDRLPGALDCCSHHVRPFAEAVRALASPPPAGVSHDSCEHATFSSETVF